MRPDNLHVRVVHEPGWPPHGQIWDGDTYQDWVSAACSTDEQVMQAGEEDICRLRAYRELMAAGQKDAADMALRGV